MSLKALVNQWEAQAQGALTKETYEVHLTVEDAAKINALTEMYPKRSKEQLIRELVTAALTELEASFPYVQGNKVVSTDELGDPIFEDVGPTPAFITLTKKHQQRLTTN